MTQNKRDTDWEFDKVAGVSLRIVLDELRREEQLSQMVIVLIDLGVVRTICTGKGEEFFYLPKLYGDVMMSQPNFDHLPIGSFDPNRLNSSTIYR